MRLDIHLGFTERTGCRNARRRWRHGVARHDEGRVPLLDDPQVEQELAEAGHACNIPRFAN